MSAEGEAKDKWYGDGYDVGLERMSDPTYDVRHDLAAASKAGFFHDFKRGMEDAMADMGFFHDFKRGMEDAMDGKGRQP